MKIGYVPKFIRMYNALPEGLQEEVREAIEDLKDKRSHVRLKVHKLSGRLEGRYAFSVNYRIRIIFSIEKRSRNYILYSVGDHDIYHL